MTDIIIAGNGSSRKNYDLGIVKGALKCPLYVCNLGYKDLPYDKVFAIDDGVIDELKKENIPFVEVPDDMKWEPPYDGPFRPRNNTGMVAMQWAILEGYRNLHLYGFDFILPDLEQKTSNMFEGHPLYGPETACSLEDSYKRIKYLNWMITSNPTVKFTFYFPEYVK